MHTVQQGQRWDYFGSVDGSDRWARAVGPRVVVLAAVAVGVAVWVAAVRGPDRAAVSGGAGAAAFVAGGRINAGGWRVAIRARALLLRRKAALTQRKRLSYGAPN